MCYFRLRCFLYASRNIVFMYKFVCLCMIERFLIQFSGKWMFRGILSHNAPHHNAPRRQQRRRRRWQQLHFQPSECKRQYVFSIEPTKSSTWNENANTRKLQRKNTVTRQKSQNKVNVCWLFGIVVGLGFSFSPGNKAGFRCEFYSVVPCIAKVISIIIFVMFSTNVSFLGWCWLLFLSPSFAHRFIYKCVVCCLRKLRSPCWMDFYYFCTFSYFNGNTFSFFLVPRTTIPYLSTITFD